MLPRSIYLSHSSERVIVRVRAQFQILGSNLKQYFTRLLAHNFEGDVTTSRPVHHLQNHCIRFAFSWCLVPPAHSSFRGRGQLQEGTIDDHNVAWHHRTLQPSVFILPLKIRCGTKECRVRSCSLKVTWVSSLYHMRSKSDS